MKGQIFRETLNFSKYELLGLHRVGIQIGAPERVAAGTAIEMFGMFGDGNNSNTFYPGLTAADFMPKPEDMVDIPFRLISATTVGANSWKATNFSDAKVLKASVPKLANKPIFFDHEQSVPNWLGITVAPYWQESFTAPDGTVIPAGINGTHRIDAKSNPKIARGLVMGAIGSNSVTVQFDWTPSHTFESIDQFYDNMGTIAKDGKMVTRMVTNIIDYHETSLVWLGADPFAKKVDATGNPINVDKGSVQYSAADPLTFSKADSTEKGLYQAEKKFVINYCIDDNIISLSKKENQTPAKVTLNNNENNIQMKKFLLAFLAAYGTKLNLNIVLADGADLTPAQESELTTAMAKLTITPSTEELGKRTKTDTFVAGLKLVNEKGELVSFDVQTATGEYHLVSATEKTRVYSLAAEVETLKPQALLGTEYLNMKRSETIRLYKVSMGDNADSAVEELMQKADSKALDGLLKQYAKGSLLKFTATCTKCNSNENIEMRSSVVSGKTEETENTGTGALSIAEIAAKKSSASMVIGRNVPEA